MTEISIIVPVYNVKAYLRKCVQSIQAQSWIDWELILSDDASTDGSLALCEELAAGDPRIRVLKNSHGGVSWARNRGLEEARGNWICFVDSDDWLEKDFLERAYSAAMKTGADVAMVALDSVLDGRVLYVNATETPISGRSMELDQYQMVELLNKAYTSGAAAKLYRASVIGDIRFTDGMVFGEDLTFCYCILEKNIKIWADPYVGYHYRVTPNSLLSVVSDGKIRDVVKTYHKLFDSVLAWGWADGPYQQFVQERCADDVLGVQSMILRQKVSWLKKWKQLKILCRDRRIASVLVAKKGYGSVMPLVILAKQLVCNIKTGDWRYNFGNWLFGKDGYEKLKSFLKGKQ